ncbi:MAG: OprO/OprP family phosphate-selective porin [Alphaproteobacteria bacterium]|jgi:phosphate-selective porin OprO/OprP|nr:OprO/OprP family phosphate-selective porin [Alphaproteobacteria bacterium]
MRSFALSRLALLALLTTAYPAAAATPDVAARINALEQELNLLKRQLEVQQEEQKNVASKQANVEYGRKGLKISSPDNQYSLSFRGYAQADSRSFIDNSNTGNVDTFLIRTARPIFEATFPDDFRARLMLDFGGGQTRLLDAFVDYTPDSALKLRAGKFKAPIGLERWQSEQEILFVERGMATNLVPFRDIGVQVSGELMPQQLEYNIAYTTGAVDIGDPNTDSDNGKDITARLFAHPFRNSDTVAAQGLGVGLAGSIGDRDGALSSPNLGDGYRTPAQAKFFSYTSGTTLATTTIAAGTKWRVNPQAYYYYGSFSALGEYVRTSQDVKRGSAEQTLNNDAFTFISTYVLTGENASFDGVKPKANFNPKRGTWGAFEIVGRYSVLRVDSDTFPTFASLASSASEARDATLGVTWYLNDSLKFNLNYSETHFDGGAASGQDREMEKVVLSRAQFRF